MKRALFVDDEPRVLAGLRRVLTVELGDSWKLLFAGGGEEALGLLERCDVDVLVTDMRMPRMDGASLLLEVQRRYPAIVRVVLTGFADQRMALRALPVAHSVIAKPAKRGQIGEVLARASRSHRFVSDEALLRMLGGTSALPPRPAVYAEVVRLLADEEADITSVVEVIERDIAITVQLLKVANSPFFYRGNRVNTVLDAVQRLGGERVADLVLAIEVSRLSVRPVAGMSLDQVYEDGLAVGALARRLVEQLGDTELDPDDVFLAGMLHDVGLLVAAQHLPRVLARLVALGLPSASRERMLLGATHGELGASLLGLWGFGYELIEAVAFHHRPWEVPHPRLALVDLVFIADALIHRTLEAEAEPETEPGAESGQAEGRRPEQEPGEIFTKDERIYLATLGVSARRLDTWRRAAREVTQERQETAEGQRP